MLVNLADSAVHFELSDSGKPEQVSYQYLTHFLFESRFIVVTVLPRYAGAAYACK